MVSKKMAIGLFLMLSVLNPVTGLPTLTLIAALWLLQRPAPASLTGAAAAPGVVKRISGLLWMTCQKNIDNTRVNQTTAARAAAGGDKLLWHFSFGANMNPEILGGRRKVTPKQTLPCCVEGFQLLFSHRGLPYWEPSFATIAEADALEACPEIDGARSNSDGVDTGSAAKSIAAGGDANSSPSRTGPTLRSATRAARAQTSSSNGSMDGSGGASVTTGTAHDGTTNSGRTAGSRPQKTTQQKQRGFAAGVIQQLSKVLAALGGLVLADSTPPVMPRQYRAADGRPAVHGVVHQITAADMAQIQATEGGGGHEKMGYNLEEVKCSLYDGSSITAVAFTTHPGAELCKSLVYGHPSERYLRVCQVGATTSGLEDDYQRWLGDLAPYTRSTLGQFVGAYVVLVGVLSAGAALAAGLLGYRLLTWRKPDSYWLHVIIQATMGAVWWLHNNVLSSIFGRGC